ncbi:MAG: GxxExxY protein [Muribaculaceae bacterium]|nr:GxxExxY protein [Muribaculaceae bacterium]
MILSLFTRKKVTQLLGAAQHVHSVLGRGFLEEVYQEALEIEFKRRGIPYEREKRLAINYDGIRLQKFYVADFVCYDKIIVELKALLLLAGEHEAQTLNYLKATGFKLGILMNFGESHFSYKRLINRFNQIDF